MRSTVALIIGFIFAACQAAAPATNVPAQAPPTTAATNAATAPAPQATVPRLTGLIAFQRTGDGIFTVDPYGNGQRRILPATYQNPRWSPSGERLALSHILDDEHGIVVPAIANADGSGAHDVPLRQKGLSCGAPVWSPDGVWLAAECWDQGHEKLTGIYVLRAADGDGLRQVTVGHAIPGGFSNDGTRLVFSDDQGRLWIVGVNGTGARIMREEGVGAYPGFMPEGSAVFASMDGVIAIVDLDGRVIQQVRAPEPRMAEARLGPDGTTFVFTYGPQAAAAPGLARIGRHGQGFADILVARAGEPEDVGADWRP